MTNFAALPITTDWRCQRPRAEVIESHHLRTREANDTSRRSIFMDYLNPKINLIEIAEKMPNFIFQISAQDLLGFAKQLIKEAKSVARIEFERAEQEKELLTIEETAAQLKVSKMTLHRWNKAGILPKVEVGGRRYYRRADVEVLIKNQCGYGEA